jgi:lysyl-tRNA synthetase class 2
MLHRSFGKICFASISDGTGDIQVLFARDNCSIYTESGVHTELVCTPDAPLSAGGRGVGGEVLSAYKFAEKMIDLGDFVGVCGELFYTHKGELTLFVSEFTFLTKAIRPLPEKYHGIESDEERYRKRYLDTTTDADLRAMYYRKAKFWDATRTFLQEKGFLEVDTPTLEHTTGGAEARPFKTYHNDYDVDVYLRICVGELWQKRLMAGGFPKTFEI